MLRKRLTAALLVCVLCLLSGTDCRGMNQEKSLREQAQGLIGGAADACLRICGGLPEQARGLIEEWKGLLSETGCQGMNQGKGLLEQAQELIEERKYPQAIGLLSGIADDEAAASLLEQLYYVISGDYIENLDVGIGVAAIDREGHVRIAAHPVYFKGLHRDQEATLEMIGKWEDIRRLHGGCGLDALDKDGGFHTVRGDEGYDDFTERNRQIAELEPLKLLFSYIYDFAVLRMDGTIYAYDKYSGYTGKDYVKQQMAQWTDVKDMVSGPDIVMVLLGDGTVDFVSAGVFGQPYLDTLEWTDIVAIDGLGMTGCIAGLTSEGTVVVSNHGVDENGAVYTDAFEWTDIIAISKGFESLLGLKRDGTVVAAGNLRSGQEDIAEWKDIVAISAGLDIHVGLKSDGTIVMAGDFGGRWELPDLTNMKDLYVPEVSLGSIDEPACSSVKPSSAMVMEYEKEMLTFEEIIQRSDVAIVGEYVETIRYDSYIEQKFKVKECLYGDVADSEIYLYAGIGIGHIEEIDYTYELDADVYEAGIEYILIMEKAQSVMYDHDRYMLVADVYLCDSNGIYSMYSRAVDIPGEATLKDYITSTYSAVPHSSSQADPVSYENEVARMMGESEYVGTVKILELVNEGKVHNGNVYRCSVESLSKGSNLNTYDDGTVLIVILKNTVEVGNSYIVGFSPVDKGSLIYTQSTDTGVYDINDERISGIL